VSDVVGFGFDVLLLVASLPNLIFLDHSSDGLWSETFFIGVDDDTDLVASLTKILVSDPSTCGHELDVFFEVVEDEGIVQELE
jgi:hypothetical protein